MLIKEPDDQSEVIAELERLSQASDPQTAKRAAEDLRNRRAGLRGEQESMYHINFHYGASRRWAVIHDLRLEHEGRVAQIDHLIMNRALDIYLLESKHFHAGLKITEQGEFMRWNDYRRRFEGMPSPLEQNERHIAVLKEVLKTLDLPTRAGMRLMPSIRSFVLVSPNSRIDRPKQFDSSRVIKADGLKTAIIETVEGASMASNFLSLTRLASQETVKDIAEQLTRRHQPLAHRAASTPVRAASTPAQPTSVREERMGLPAEVPAPVSREARPSCKFCEDLRGIILHGKYGYYFQCAACSKNTPIRFTCKPGHKPKLRKALEKFYRECADCGSSTLYFSNPT